MLRGPIGIVIGGALALAAVALVAGGPRAFEAVLPQTAIAFLEGQGSFGSLTGPVGPGRGEHPADFLSDSPDGLKASGPIAAGPGNAPVFIRDVIAGHTPGVAQDIPAEVTTIRPILGCRLTPPLDGSAVGHVAAGPSGVPTALATYGDAELAAAVQDFADHYRRSGKADAWTKAAPTYEAFDVAVTETAAPVYLVLHNPLGNRLWNIHLAPGARIERVVLLGGGQAGVANLDPVVPVEVMLGEGLDACGIRPALPLNPGHRYFQAVADGSGAQDEAAARMAAHDAAVASYDTWFRDSFGVTASGSRIGYDLGMIALVGPVPGATEARAIFAPLSAARIRATQDRYFEIAGQVPEGADFAARVRAIATAFAWGELSNLRQGLDF